MLTFLIILCAIVFGVVFGASFLAALAKTVFDFFKWMFQAGYGCSKAIIDIFIIALITVLIALFAAKCG